MQRGRMIRRTGLVFAGLLFSLIVWSQSTSTAPPGASSAPMLKSSALQADVQILRKAYEELHPGLYRYNSKAEMDAKFEALQAKLAHDQSLADAYLAFSIFAAQVKCGHTYPNFFNQDETVVSALFHGQNRVPFYFHWLGREMIVTRDFTPGHSLPRGTRILSINGTQVQTILDRLMAVARADGSNDAKRVATLEVTGDSNYEAFDVYFPLMFPPRGISLQLLLQTPGQTRADVVNVTALTYEERISPIKEQEASRRGGSEALFDWKYLADGSAYLRMPTWALYNSKWDWRAWLNSKFDELATKNAPALIVDIRGNEGGNDVGNEILGRLVQHDLVISPFRRLVRYRQTPAELNPYLDTWDSSFKNWGASAVELGQPWPTAPPVPYFALTKYDDNASGEDVIHPAQKPFRGKLYVLIDANNSSATFQFAQVVQQNKLGTLVGQPTGGNQRGINGGAFFFLRLPNSRIEMDLPLVGTFPSSPQPDRGLMPDFPVVPTVEDIVQGRDAEMAAVLGLQQKRDSNAGSR